MKLQTAEYRFKLLTPCFCGGADNKAGQAEMRVPSIRGLFREWHCAAGKQPSAPEVWGVSATASKVAVSLVVPVSQAIGVDERKCSPELRALVSLVVPVSQAIGRFPLLPHKSSGQGLRSALKEGQEFSLLLARLIGCSDAHWKTANDVVRLWLLLGCLGARSNRAAGSVWPVSPAPPLDLKAFSAELRNLVVPAAWSIAVLQKPYTNASDLRRDASLTHGNRSTTDVFGGINPKRVPSPFKVKAVELSGALRLVLFSPTENIFAAARQHMANEPMGREACETIWPTTA